MHAALFRVPAKAGHNLKITVTYKKGLAACVFFSRTAVITDRALQVMSS